MDKRVLVMTDPKSGMRKDLVAVASLSGATYGPNFEVREAPAVPAACLHACVIKVPRHARDCFPGEKLHAVMGGFHLSGATETIIPQTVGAMRVFGLKSIAAAHCTG